MQHIAGHDRPRRGRGRAGVVGQAAVHDAGDLDRCRIPPGRSRGRADDAGRLARLGRRHQVEYHAVGDPAGQLEHPRPERGQVDRQVGPHRRAVERHHAGAEQLAVIPGRAGRPEPPGCTPTYSSIIGSGGNGGSPNRAFITVFPTPRPRMNRPSDAWSSCAAVLAASTGGRSAALATAVPTRARRVAAIDRMAQRQSVAMPFGHEHRAEAGCLSGRGQRADRRPAAARCARRWTGRVRVRLPRRLRRASSPRCLLPPGRSRRTAS